jgi:catechol 2,3-dioxygenase-like lactoylglutathione lyase family enzyme
MARDTVDHEGLNRPDIADFYASKAPADIPFALGKISHVVLRVKDLERSVKFYCGVLGLHVSDAYPESMMSGRMVFLRYDHDHHGIALVGERDGEARGSGLHHFAFEVGSLEEVFRARTHLEQHGVEIHFEGRRRAGQQVAIEFTDPDGHNLEICWGMDQVAPNESSRPPEQWRTALSLEAAVQDPPEGQDNDLSDQTLVREE